MDFAPPLPDQPLPTAPDASPKRRQVVDAAAELFMAHGYGAVSMDNVARTAGVSKATLYAHFASKDQLFATIVVEMGRQKSLAVDNFPDAVEDIEAALMGIGGRLLRFMVQERTLAIYRVAVAESARFPELGRAFMLNGPLAFRERFAAWVATQAAAGHLNAPDPLLAGEQFSALLRSGVFLRATLALDPAPTDAEIDATVRAAVVTFLRAFGHRGLCQMAGSGAGGQRKEGQGAALDPLRAGPLEPMT